MVREIGKGPQNNVIREMWLPKQGGTKMPHAIKSSHEIGM